MSGASRFRDHPCKIRMNCRDTLMRVLRIIVMHKLNNKNGIIRENPCASVAKKPSLIHPSKFPFFITNS